MYHYITLGASKIYLTGIGIILFLITFLVSVRRYSRRYHLSFSAFFRIVPQSLLIIYLLGTYSRYLIESFVVFSTNPHQWLLYLTPHGYTFHFVGILLGIFACGHLFLRRIKPEHRPLWLEVFFHSFMWALIPLGIGLVLGDNFIGKQIDSGFFVSAIRADSAVAVYDKVIPLGLYLSLLGLAGHFLTKLLDNLATRKGRQGRGYLAFGLFLVVLGLLLIWQQYPRHIVLPLAGVSLDIKQYLTRGVAAFFFYKHLTTNPSSSTRNEERA